MKYRSFRPVLTLTLILAGCADVAGPTNPDPLNRTAGPRVERLPQAPIRVAGTNPSLASLAPDCPTRCGYALPLGNRSVEGLNEMADVTGRLQQSAQPEIFVWRHGRSISSRPSLGDDPSASPHDLATDLNDYGQVVGVTNDDSLEVCRSAGCIADLGRAAIWEPDGQVIDIGTFGGRNSQANAVNDLPAVVGWAATENHVARASQEIHAFYWTWNGGIEDLGTLGGLRSGANDINDRGEVVGWSEFGQPIGSGSHAFIWKRGEGMRDLGTLPGYLSTEAFAINEHGVVVGKATGGATSESRAVMWTTSGQIVDLGTLGGRNSYATDINHWGEVVGVSDTENGQRRVFVWRQDTGMVALAPAGTTNHAVGNPKINSWGDVIGQMITSGQLGITPTVWVWAENRSRWGF